MYRFAAFFRQPGGQPSPQKLKQIKALNTAAQNTNGRRYDLNFRSGYTDRPVTVSPSPQVHGEGLGFGGADVEDGAEFGSVLDDPVIHPTCWCSQATDLQRRALLGRW